MSYSSYKDLIVWQKAMDLVDEVYRLVRLLPKEEMFALSDQLRRSAISVPSNIAEGHGRHSRREFTQFLSIARGSVFELETQLTIGIRQTYFTEVQAQTALGLCQEIGKILTRMTVVSGSSSPTLL